MTRVRRHKDGYIDQIACGVCGAVIATFGPSGPEPYSAREVEPGKTVYVFPGVLQRNNLYTEVTLRMDNGDRHVTHICTRCAVEQRRNLAVLQGLHDGDIEDLRQAEGMAAPSVRRL